MYFFSTIPGFFGKTLKYDIHNDCREVGHMFVIDDMLILRSMVILQLLGHLLLRNFAFLCYKFH